MLQITKGLTTSLFIPVGYINDNAGNLSRSAFAWDAGDIVTVKLIHGKNILGYSGTTSDKGVTFTLSGDEVGTFKVTLTVERGGVEHVCTVDRLVIADEITSNRDTLGGVYFYAQNDAIQFIQAYGDNGKPAIISDVNAVATKGGGGGATLVPITYAELVAARDNGQLIAGAMYRITDYTTTTTQAETSAAGHDFDIIVTALDAHTLSEDAHAIQHEGDEYFNGSNLAAWRLRYCLDNDTNRFAWAGGDTPARWRIVVDGDPWDYVRAKSHDNDGDEYPYAWAYDNDGEIDEYDLMFTQNELPAVGDIAVQDGNEYEITSVTPPQEGNGKGVIYYMRDEYGNECPYDFKNIMFTVVEGDDPLYTFVGEGEEVGDYLDTTIFGYCTNNVVKPCFSNAIQVLNRVAFEDFTNNCYIGYDCRNITLGSFNHGGATSVKIANNCSDIHLFNGARFINIGAQCENVTFVENLFARYIDICSATSNVILECAEDTSVDNYAQNIVITHGVGIGGDEDNPKTITIPHAGAQYTTTIGRATDVKINV